MVSACSIPLHAATHRDFTAFKEVLYQYLKSQAPADRDRMITLYKELDKDKARPEWANMARNEAKVNKVDIVALAAAAPRRGGMAPVVSTSTTAGSATTSSAPAVPKAPALGAYGQPARGGVAIPVNIAARKKEYEDIKSQFEALSKKGTAPSADMLNKMSTVMQKFSPNDARYQALHHIIEAETAQARAAIPLPEASAEDEAFLQGDEGIQTVSGQIVIGERAPATPLAQDMKSFKEAIQNADDAISEAQKDAYEAAQRSETAAEFTTSVARATNNLKAASNLFASMTKLLTAQDRTSFSAELDRVGKQIKGTENILAFEKSLDGIRTALVKNPLKKLFVSPNVEAAEKYYEEALPLLHAIYNNVQTNVFERLQTDLLALQKEIDTAKQKQTAKATVKTESTPAATDGGSAAALKEALILRRSSIEPLDTTTKSPAPAAPMAAPMASAPTTAVAPKAEDRAGLLAEIQKGTSLTKSPESKKVEEIQAAIDHANKNYFEASLNDENKISFADAKDSFARAAAIYKEIKASLGATVQAQLERSLKALENEINKYNKGVKVTPETWNT